MLKIIKALKKDSKKFIKKNYFKIILPLLIFMVLNSVTYLIWNYFMMDGSVFGNDFPIFLCLITIVLFQFIACPVTIVWFYKSYLHISKNQTENTIKALSFIKEKGTLKNIIKLNFLPALLNVLILIFCNGNIIYHTKNGILLFICCVLKAFFTYKLFICNYYFSASNKTAKTVFKISFGIMRKKIKSFIVFYISFIGWFALAVILMFIFKGISLGELFSFGMLFSFKIYTPILNSLAAYLYGIGFFLYPYMLITKTEYCKKIIGDTVFEKLV